MTFERLKKDPKVSEAWHEGVDGYWVILKKGWKCGNSDCHAVHEWTVKTLVQSFKSVVKCTCKDCI